MEARLLGTIRVRAFRDFGMRPRDDSPRLLQRDLDRLEGDLGVPRERRDHAGDDLLKRAQRLPVVPSERLRCDLIQPREGERPAAREARGDCACVLSTFARFDPKATAGDVRLLLLCSLFTLFTLSARLALSLQEQRTHPVLNVL